MKPTIKIRDDDLDIDQIYLRNKRLPRADAEFEWTPERINEIKKCRENLRYFAENHFHITTLDDGKQKISLYPAQKRVLKALEDNRFVILCASRQSGKCFSTNTILKTRNKKTDNIEEITVGSLFNRIKDFKKYDLHGRKMNVKFIESFEIEDYEIWTDTGWEDISHIHKTIQFDVWELITETNKILLCADDHIIFDKDYNQLFIKDCIQNKTKVITEDGPELVISIKKLDTSAENMYDITVQSNNHRLYTNKILSHNTTIMTIYALWLTCFNADKRVVIVANKEKTAIMILRRVKMAYEELPNWLKPGTAQWGNTEVIFGNDSSIAISTTTGSAVRGESVNCIIIDEMSHIEPHLIEEFWASVIPVISSTRKGTTKIFACSTPNGTGNKFYEIYNKAERQETTEGNLFWHGEKIDWQEVPGRGKKWKIDMMTALGGDNQLFRQEFENYFVETGESAVDAEVLETYKSICRLPLHVFDNGHYKLWAEPQEKHLYGIGVDVSEGIGRASSVAQIMDFTDLTKIQQVGVYFNNLIHPLQFAEVLSKIGNHWGCPPMLIERNSCGAEVITALKETHNYNNIVSYNPDKLKYGDIRPGIYSHTNTKYNGVMNMRYWVNSLKVVEIFDIATVQEMQTFVRYPNGTWKAKQGNNIYDDRVMSLIWSLFILNEDICQQYYEIVDYDDRGKPLKVSNYITTSPTFFRLDPFFQKDRDAPLPAFIGFDPMAIDQGRISLMNGGWRVLNNS